MKDWGASPYFAIMTKGEYTGASLERCSLVVEVFARKAVRERKIKGLWASVDAIARKTGVLFSIQAAATNKVRIGIMDAAEAQVFLRAAVPELDARGYIVKDERTQEFISGAIDDDTEGTDGGSESEGDSSRNVQDNMVLYDAGPW